jgi:hypothetical protein
LSKNSDVFQSPPNRKSWLFSRRCLRPKFVANRPGYCL